MTNLSGISFSLLFVLSTVNGYLVDVPENTVGMVDTTITLHCEAAADSQPSARVMWTEFVTNSLGRVISDNRGILPSHPNAHRYQISGGPNEFNLEIRNATLLDGGRYLCADIMSNAPLLGQGHAEVVVLTSDPKCTYIESITGVLVENLFYMKECEINYQGNFMPNMTWTGPGEFSVQNSITSSHIWSRVSFTAYRSIEGERFVCTTKFVDPSSPLPPNSATNIPDYQYVFNGSTIIVNWSPQEMTIIPRKEIYEVDDVLTCEADGKPPPRFIWTNLRTQKIEDEGATFTITSDLLGTEQLMRCSAFNNIEGSQRLADAFVNVTVPAVTSPTTPPTTTPTTTPPADSPCNDLTGQWTSSNPNANLCVEVDTSGNVLALLRNGTDSFFVSGNGKTVYNDYKHVGFSGIWPPGSAFGVGGFSGECHRCLGNEVLQISGLARNKDHGPTCGESAGTRLTNLYTFTRFGPPCRNLNADVYKPSEAHIRVMNIPKEHIFL